MALDLSYTHPPSKLPGARDKIFVRASNSATTTSFLNGFLDVNDAVTVSVKPHLLALACTFILELTPTDVVVGVDRDHIRSRLSVFDPSQTTMSVVFRIDKDEMQGGMSRIRDTLAQLFYADGDARKLELVVDLRPPAFDEVSSISIPSSAACHLAHLNSNQHQAIYKVISAQDYALVLDVRDRQNDCHCCSDQSLRSHGQDCSLDILYTLCCRYDSAEAG